MGRKKSFVRTNSIRGAVMPPCNRAPAPADDAKASDDCSGDDDAGERI
jgi:hypothetical protein